MSFLKNLQINALVTALLYVALGLLFILLPEAVAASISIIVAASLLIAGILYVVNYFRTWDIEYRSNGLAIGILLIFAAAFLFFQREIVTAIIPLLLGFAVIISGALKLQNAIVMSRAKVRIWLPTLILAIVCLILGFIIMLDPFRSLSALIIMIGVSLLVSGLTDLVILILMARRKKAIAAAGHRGEDVRPE